MAAGGLTAPFICRKLPQSIRTYVRVGETVNPRGRVELLSLLRVKGVSWHFIAREAQRHGVTGLLAGDTSEDGVEAQKSLEALRAMRSSLPALHGEVEKTLDSCEREGIRLTTVLDDDYPLNLRTIYNLPPFLFYRGALRAILVAIN